MWGKWTGEGNCELEPYAFEFRRAEVKNSGTDGGFPVKAMAQQLGMNRTHENTGEVGTMIRKGDRDRTKVMEDAVPAWRVAVPNPLSTEKLRGAARAAH